MTCTKQQYKKKQRNKIRISGDSAYFKRASDKRWKGPRKVLGQDGQQVLVKYVCS